jgi:pyridoxine 5-phosphate synthase
MTKLSVNINKIATLRNARGKNTPNVLQVALDCERFGAEGITVHPRPDQRHIRYSDVHELKPKLSTEFNIEGKPIPEFIKLVLAAKPAQVTLVPDAENAITSDAGWDAVKYQDQLKKHIATFKNAGIRTSIFIDPVPEQIAAAATTGTDRIELYTEDYAVGFYKDAASASAPYAAAAQQAHELGMGVNAGHDLNLDNLKYFAKAVPHLAEVSIGHALIADALYYGLENTIQQYLRQLDANV